MGYEQGKIRLRGEVLAPLNPQSLLELAPMHLFAEGVAVRLQQVLQAVVVWLFFDVAQAYPLLLRQAKLLIGDNLRLRW